MRGLPVEILREILLSIRWMSPDDEMAIRLVCKLWQQLLDGINIQHWSLGQNATTTQIKRVMARRGPLYIKITTNYDATLSNRSRIQCFELGLVFERELLKVTEKIKGLEWTADSLDHAFDILPPSGAGETSWDLEWLVLKVDTRL